MNDPIKPIGALDVLLEAGNPELVGKVTPEWLRDKQSGRPDGLALDSADLDDETKAAMAAVTTLKRHVREYKKIRLWGMRDGKGGDRAPIEDDHQQEGELLIWDATFEGPEIPDGPFKVQAWRYTDVRFVKSEVQRIADDKPADIESAIAIIELELSVDAAVAGKRLLEAWRSGEVEVWFQRAGLAHAWYTKPFPPRLLSGAAIHKGRLTDSRGADCETEQWVIRTGCAQLRSWLKKHTSAEQVENKDEIAGCRPQNMETQSEKIREQTSTAEPDRAGRKRGVKSPYDWDDVIQFVQQQWSINGDPDDFQNRKSGWASDQDVAKAALNYMATSRLHNYTTPDISTVRKHLKPVLARLRAK